MVFDGSGPSADVAKLSRDDAGQPSIPLTVGSHCTGWVWTVPGVNPQPISAVKSTTDKQRESKSRRYSRWSRCTFLEEIPGKQRHIVAQCRTPGFLQCLVGLYIPCGEDWSNFSGGSRLHLGL